MYRNYSKYYSKRLLCIIMKMFLFLKTCQREIKMMEESFTLTPKFLWKYSPAWIRILRLHRNVFCKIVCLIRILKTICFSPSQEVNVFGRCWHFGNVSDYFFHVDFILCVEIVCKSNNPTYHKMCLFTRLS